MESLMMLVAANVGFWGIIALVVWVFSINHLAGVLLVLDLIGWIIVINRQPYTPRYSPPKEPEPDIWVKDGTGWPHHGGY